MGWRESGDDRADDLYDRARDLIEQAKFDRAVADLDRLIGMKSNRTDAAMYWKAYSLSKLGQRAEALTTLGDLIKQYGDSRWLEGRQGARSRSAPGLGPGGLPGVAGR